MNKNHFSYWNGISAFLMNTSESEHLQVNIIIDTPEDQGLSDNDKMVITEIWQEPKEGIITFKIYGSDEEFDLSEYPELFEQIYNYLSGI